MNVNDFFLNKKVIKKSGKPFKSTLKSNTVKEITVNPETNNICFAFFEDDSLVDSHQCILLEKPKW